MGMDPIIRYKEIRNFAIKTILGLWGFVMVAAATFPFISFFFGVLEKEPEWTKTNWLFLAAGFVLSAGAAYYNKIIEKIISIPIDKLWK